MLLSFKNQIRFSTIILVNRDIRLLRLCEQSKRRETDYGLIIILLISMKR